MRERLTAEGQQNGPLNEQDSKGAREEARSLACSHCVLTVGGWSKGLLWLWPGTHTCHTLAHSLSLAHTHTLLCHPAENQLNCNH